MVGAKTQQVLHLVALDIQAMVLALVSCRHKPQLLKLLLYLLLYAIDCLLKGHYALRHCISRSWGLCCWQSAVIFAANCYF